MSLECKSDYMIGLFGSLYFLGFVLGAIFLNRLADIYGRRYIAIGAVILSMLTGLVCLVSNSLWIAYMMVFIHGISQAVRTSVCYLYMMELVKVPL
jgi:MFS family permease